MSHPIISSRVTAIYEYCDERGRPLFSVVREAPKGFYVQRRIGGKWTRGLGDTRRVLYRLPEVLQAIAEGRVVWIAEGEKDVERLRSLGLTATTSPFGAENWKREYAEQLKGARVVMVPDQDTAGRRYGQQVADSLNGIAECWTLELPGIREGQDVSDWLDARHTLRELSPLAKVGLIPEDAVYDRASLPQSLEEKRNNPLAPVGGLAPVSTDNTLINSSDLITCQVIGVDPVWGMDEPVPVAANTDEVGVRFLDAVARPEGVPIGRNFRCILPDHEDDSPSAQLYRDEKNFLRYRCFAGRHRKGGWSLAQAWAYVRTQREAIMDQQWNAGVLIAWQARMLLELGLQPWPDLGLTDPPPEAPSSAQATWAGFKSRLAAARLHDLTNMYAQPFGKEFASAWCSLSTDDVWNGLRWLLKNGWLNHLGWMPLRHYKVNVYATGPASGINVTWWTRNPNPGIVM